jgi:predicted transcriptional regulator
MINIELGAVQERFADLVWANEPIASGELVRICEKELQWKKPTTYTVLRKLCEKGLLRNADGIVTTRISRDEFYAKKSEQIVQGSYQGSLPAFVAAFVSRNGLSAGEADEIRQMIDAFRKGEQS